MSLASHASGTNHFATVGDTTLLLKDTSRGNPRCAIGPKTPTKQPWPDRLTNRPLRRSIQCRGRLTPYPDTRASVGQAEVTAVTSPLFFTVQYDGKTAPLASLRLPCQPPRRRLTTSHDQPPSSASGTTGSSATPDLRLRPREEAPPRPTPGLGLDLGLGRNRVLARPRPRPQEKSLPRLTLCSDRPRHRGYIITLP